MSKGSSQDTFFLILVADSIPHGVFFHQEPCVWQALALLTEEGIEGQGGMCVCKPSFDGRGKQRYPPQSQGPTLPGGLIYASFSLPKPPLK